MVEEDKRNDVKLWLKSGLGVATLSIGGYLLGFAYEKGYADYFGIPVQLIKLNLISIFLSIIGLVAVMLTLIIFVNSGYIIFSERRGVIFRAIIRSAPSVLFCVAVFYIYRNTSWRYVVVGIIFSWPVYTLFTEFIGPLITKRGKGTYYQKLEAQEETNKQMQPTTIWDIITKKRGGMIILYLITTISLLYIFANGAGMAEAQAQKSFFVVREPKPLVVLRIYGDKFVCAPFDSRAGTIEKTLYILDTPQQNGLWLDWQQVGPLKPVDKKVPEACNGK